MSNAFLDHDMYNKDLKDKFLSRFSEKAQNTYKRIFFYSAPIEEMHRMDLYEFNLNQIGELLMSLNPSSIASVRNSVSVIKAYIDFAIIHRSNNLNPLDVIDVTEWGKQFVDNTKKMLYTKDEIDEIVARLKNAQDAVIPVLLFEGAGGKEVSELRNLKPSDIDYENRTLKLIDDNNRERELVVSEQCINLVREAERQTEYIKKNGDMPPTARTSGQSELIETGYVIKPTKTRVKKLDQVNPHVIFGRLSTISEFFNLPKFTVKNIQRSGMIYMAKLILERDGHFGDNEQYVEICERFGINKVMVGGYEAYNFFGLRENINTDIINDLYGESSLS